MTWTQNKLFLPQHPQPKGKRRRSYDIMLGFIRHYGPVTQSDVCDHMGISSTKASEMLRYGRKRGELAIAGKGERGKYLIGVVR